MNTALSYPIWKYTILESVQFPWRMLVIADFSLAIGLGVLWSFKTDTKGKQVKHFSIFITIFSIIIVYISVYPRVLSSISGRMPNHAEIHMTSAPEYLPKNFGDYVDSWLKARGHTHWSTHVFLEEIANEIKGRERGVTGIERHYRRYDVTLDGTSEVILPIPYWSLMTAHGGTEPLRIVPTEEGLVSFDNREGYTNLTIEIPLHGSEKVGNALALIGLLLLAGLLFDKARRQRSEWRPVPAVEASRSQSGVGTKPTGTRDLS